MNHCVKYVLISQGQHGFIRGKSTTTAIIKITEFIIDNLDAKKQVTSLILVFTKAFD